MPLALHLTMGAMPVGVTVNPQAQAHGRSCNPTLAWLLRHTIPVHSQAHMYSQLMPYAHRYSPVNLSYCDAEGGRRRRRGRSLQSLFAGEVNAPPTAPYRCYIAYAGPECPDTGPFAAVECAGERLWGSRCRQAALVTGRYRGCQGRCQVWARCGCGCGFGCWYGCEALRCLGDQVMVGSGASEDGRLRVALGAFCWVCHVKGSLRVYYQPALLVRRYAGRPFPPAPPPPPTPPAPPPRECSEQGARGSGLGNNTRTHVHAQATTGAQHELLACCCQEATWAALGR